MSQFVADRSMKGLKRPGGYQLNALLDTSGKITQIKIVNQFLVTKHVSYQAVGVAVAVVTAVAGALIWIVCSCCFSAKRYR